jgi:hypothetical protein
MHIMKVLFGICLLHSLLNFGCQEKKGAMVAEQWSEIELVFTAEKAYENPYTDVEFRVEFSGPQGQIMVRPGFWYDGNIWKVRFANPMDKDKWTWKSYASTSDDQGLNGKSGSIISQPYSGSNPLVKKGLLRMSSGKRNVVHANGEPFMMIADTPWALPWRGTKESVTAYARKRQSQGFNAALLMTLQPDRDAEGPRSRTEPLGFDVAFEDLKDGHINVPNPEYFQMFDTLRNLLIDHGIVPVFQPVFHGFGWKGINVLGWNMDPVEYARYCRYLIARYGATPAIWLISGDSDGRDIGVIEGGEEVEKWDAYQQPTGIHYSPFCEVIPDWWNRSYEYIPHQNKINQEKEWLDFQWCQTGHGGEHQPWKVEKMYNNLPIKASANGEPTYEGIRDPANGSGWWQGHEAWLNFTSGGTMGVVYGAGGLWNWKLFQDEQGWPDWANSNVSWKEAIQLPGADYVGYLAKALAGVDIVDISLRHDLAGGQLCLAKPGEVYIVYLPEGGEVTLAGVSGTLQYRWFDPVKGEFMSEGTAESADNTFSSNISSPAVLIATASK